MKTKEIEVFVALSEIDNKVFKVTRFREYGDIEATLSFKIPEKKIEITESEFDQILIRHEHWHSIADFRKQLKEKLFGAS